MDVRTKAGYRFRVEGNFDVDLSLRVNYAGIIEVASFKTPDGNQITPKLALEVYDPKTGVTRFVTDPEEMDALGLMNLDYTEYGFEMYDTKTKGLPEALENPDEEAVKDALLNVVEALDVFSLEGYQFDEKNGELGFWKV